MKPRNFIGLCDFAGQQHKMAEFAQAQQAAADSVNKIGMRATFVCHLPSSIAAADGLLLTTYDQLYSQIAKADATVYAFPTFGAAQSHRV